MVLQFLKGLSEMGSHVKPNKNESNQQWRETYVQEACENESRN